MANSNESFKHISPEELDALDLTKVTLIDVRERDEALISGIDSAVNMPFSEGVEVYDVIPKDKPVIVFCRGGVISRQAAGILSDKGYDVSTLDGGYNAYRMYKLSKNAMQSGEACGIPKACTLPKHKSESNEISDVIDARELRCPGPIVRVADALRDKPMGYRVMIEATEDAFTSDIAVWCERTGNRLESLTNDDGVIRAIVCRAADMQQSNSEKDKTFVVFSGDLDKTIAAFIIANGAAALGRKVTMFFTFWGLNILRRPKKIKTHKTFIERLFGTIMPRGTHQLGLSRMNMCGMGAKMVRRIMKSKGIDSLECLIDSAKEHGVRLVACQMSMDIMGIRQEELIDGVELGGVATFIGAGELSDMSLFI